MQIPESRFPEPTLSIYIYIYGASRCDGRVQASPFTRLHQFNRSTIQPAVTSLKIHRAVFLAACSSGRWKQEMRGCIGFTGPQPDISEKEGMSRLSRAMSIFCHFLSVYLGDGFYCNFVLDS
jgi:hypothetical protein